MDLQEIERTDDQDNITRKNVLDNSTTHTNNSTMTIDTAAANRSLMK